MKLKNKRSGEIKEFVLFDGKNELQGGATLKDLVKEWEDVPEEQKEHWYVDCDGEVMAPSEALCNEEQNSMKQIGNYFETREEAELAVRKLKAWKRLKDKGFRFTLTPGVGSLDITPGKFQIVINADMPAEWFCCDAVQKDLDDCFGGEE